MMEVVSGSLLLEAAADERTYGTWQERVRAAGRPVGLEVRYVVSERAKALSKLALTGLGCPRVPDGFHAVRALANVRGLSLGLKRAPVEEKLTHAQQQLSGLEAQGHDTHVQQRLLAHLRAPAEGLREEQATYPRTLQPASHAGPPFTLAERKAPSSAQGERQLQPAVATLNPLQAAYPARDHHAAGRKVERPIPGRAARVDAWWLEVEHRVAPLALDEATPRWFQPLLPVGYGQTQGEKTTTPTRKTAYQQAFRQAQAARLQHPLTGDGNAAWV